MQEEKEGKENPTSESVNGMGKRKRIKTYTNIQKILIFMYSEYRYLQLTSILLTN